MNVDTCYCDASQHHMYTVMIIFNMSFTEKSLKHFSKNFTQLCLTGDVERRNKQSNNSVLGENSTIFFLVWDKIGYELNKGFPKNYIAMMHQINRLRTKMKTSTNVEHSTYLLRQSSRGQLWRVQVPLDWILVMTQDIVYMSRDCVSHDSAK